MISTVGYMGGLEGTPSQTSLMEALHGGHVTLRYQKRTSRKKWSKLLHALLSAIQTKKVEDLARLSFQTTPIYIDVDDGRTKVTNKGLQRGYSVVPSAKESVLLYSFLKKNLSKKVMVLFSSCNSVKYHSELLGYIKVDCLDIHGKQKQQKRTSTFFDFCKVEKGILRSPMGTGCVKRWVR